MAPDIKLGAGMVRNMPLSLILAALAVRLDGPRAGDTVLRLNVVDTVDGTHYAVWLQNAVLHHRVDDAFTDPDLTITAEHDVLAAIMFGLLPLDDAVKADMAVTEGDPAALARLRELLDRFDPAFPIVTP